MGGIYKKIFAFVVETGNDKIGKNVYIFRIFRSPHFPYEIINNQTTF